MRFTRFAILFALTAPVCALMSTAGRATLYDFDAFDYDTSSDIGLDGRNGGTGWNGAWFQSGGNNTPNFLAFNDVSSLSYPVPFESGLTTPSTAGTRVDTGGNTVTATANTDRLLSQTIPLDVDGTTRYVSALFRKNRANGDTNEDNVLLTFHDSVGNRRWGMGIAGADDSPWLNANGSTSAATAVTAGDTYFMVAKIVSSAAGMDSAFLKVFGTGYASEVPAAEPTTWDATLTETTAAVLDRIRVRIDRGNTLDMPGEIDEIRIADSWLEAIGQTVVNLPGDYNFDGTVDAADYVVWRKGGSPHPNTQGDYNDWRSNFGSGGPGSGTSLARSAAVPEPATVIVVAVALAMFVTTWRRPHLVLEPVPRDRHDPCA